MDTCLRPDIKSPEDLPKDLCIEWIPTGSNYICNPPVEDTDIDYVIFTFHLSKLNHWLQDCKFDPCSGKEYPEEGEFLALRKGKLNFILVDKYYLFRRWQEATELAKKLNLLQKEQRIILFDYFRNPKEEEC